MEDKDETLITHLEALRSTLLKCVAALAIGLVPMFLAAPYCMEALIKVMLSGHDLQLNYFSPMEVFILQIKVAVVLDLLVCFPYIARKIWDFVLPALYDLSSLLFVLGALFCIFFILPLIINFGVSFASPQIKAVFGISNVISTALWLAVVFGLMFQFPIVTYALIRWGIASYEGVKSKRPYVFVAILIVAALLTPPDVVSQLMLAIPTYLLFEAGLFCAGKSINNEKKDLT